MLRLPVLRLSLCLAAFAVGAPLAVAGPGDGPVPLGTLLVAAEAPEAGAARAGGTDGEIDPVIGAPEAPRLDPHLGPHLGPYQATVSDGGRTWSVSPYLWMTSINGTASFGDKSARLDVGFNDLLDNLDFGALVHVETDSPDNSVFLDTIYLSLSSDVEGSGVKAEADMSQWIVELGGGLVIDRVVAPATADEPERETRRIEVIAGGRYYRTDIDVKLSGAVTASPDHTGDWIDPFIGLRGDIEVARKLIFSARGDLGGFGVGSEHSWNALGALQYRATESVDIVVGYRALYFDYQNGDFSIDPKLSGPLVGLTFRF